MWARLNHQNIIRCFSVTVDPLEIAMEWMPNGQAIRYAQENQGADRVLLVRSPPSTPERWVLTPPRNTVDWCCQWAGLPPFTWGGPRKLEAGQLSNRATFRVVLMPRVKENILVDSAGHARLSDIEVSKLIPTGESGFDWANVGPDGCRWTAPEVFQNGKLSEQSDVFTYGFVAVEVRPPYRRLVSLSSTLPRYSREVSYGKSLMQRK